MSEEIRVVRGAPTDEEWAAVVSVLRARPARAIDVAVRVSRWARSARPGATARGSGAWRASALPHWP